jgi:hypothetical protein
MENISKETETHAFVLAKTPNSGCGFSIFALIFQAALVILCIFTLFGFLSLIIEGDFSFLFVGLLFVLEVSGLVALDKYANRFSLLPNQSLQFEEEKIHVISHSNVRHFPIKDFAYILVYYNGISKDKWLSKIEWQYKGENYAFQFAVRDQNEADKLYDALQKWYFKGAKIKEYTNGMPSYLFKEKEFGLEEGKYEKLIAKIGKN